MSDSYEIEGHDEPDTGLGSYPIDELLIRPDNRTIHDVCRRIKQERYIMDPDFQRDFIWDEEKQSRLIQSVIMRIPLPVFYLAEDSKGRMIVVDGLQRLTTFYRFMNDDLKLKLRGHILHGKKFSTLEVKHQNRFEDFNLIFYIIDSKVPEQARLDIFERVNSGKPLTRQQMRNALHSGPATQFLRREARAEDFEEVIGGSLDPKTMRDREFVNRFCSFYLLGVKAYRGHSMDEFLAAGLDRMNCLEKKELGEMSRAFRLSLQNNASIFGKHAFRRSIANLPSESGRSVINASLWDVMSIGFAGFSRSAVEANRIQILEGVRLLLSDSVFVHTITQGTNDNKKVSMRFKMTNEVLQDIFRC